MQRSRLVLLAFLSALFFAASCGDDDSGSNSDAGEDGGSLVPDGGPATCGNNQAEGMERCDGTDLRDQTCTSATHGVMSGGTLSCNANCTFNVSLCTGDDGGTEDDGGIGGTGG